MVSEDIMNFLHSSLNQYNEASAEVKVKRANKKYTLHINFTFNISLGQTARLCSVISNFLSPVPLNNSEEKEVEEV